VSYGNAALQEHYQKAAATRALLKALGCWPTDKRKVITPRRRKAASTRPPNARRPTEWAYANGQNTRAAATRFGLSVDSIHSYRQYRQLPPLRK